MNSLEPLSQSKDIMQFSELFGGGQIRLATLSVYNWGSFDGLHSAKIDPQGTLVTGDNGAGKSTLIDGLMALLMPAGKASFNVAAAQGDKTDRSLVSYMRGSYGSVYDGANTRVKSKREKGVVTGLSANYQDERGGVVTLSAVFWLAKGGNTTGDIKRIYIVATKPLELKAILHAFDGGQARSLKHWLKQEGVYSCDDFSQYQALYRKHLYMDNKNAPALLSRALGLKKIDDLTQLIRELVLEPSNVKEDAKKVVAEFADLVATHEQLLDARAQQNCLENLPEHNINRVQAFESISKLEAEKEALPAYFGRVGVTLWQQKVEQLGRVEAETSALLVECRQQNKDATILVERRHGDFLQLGGDRIEQLEKEQKTAREKLVKANERASRYQQVATELGLNKQLSQITFNANQNIVEQRVDDLKEDEDKAQIAFADVRAELKKYDEDIESLEGEIEEIESRPDSNIDLRYQKLRDEMVEALGLDANLCMFIGELLDVKQEQLVWQGAIERAMGGLPTTLVVPFDCYSMVTRWLNVRHTGLHVRVQVAKEPDNVKGSTKFKIDGYLRKLVWRVHPYREWLKNHLARYDMHCVESTVQLDTTPFSMTRQGLMQKERGRFEKKDQHRVDDRRFWQLGFSNKSRLALLRGDLDKLRELKGVVEKKVREALLDLKQVNESKDLCRELQRFDFDELNVPYLQQTLSQLEEDIEALTAAGSDVDKAKQLWLDAKAVLEELAKKKDKLIGEYTTAENNLNDAEASLQFAEQLANREIDGQIERLLSERVGKLGLDKLDKLGGLETKSREFIEVEIKQFAKQKESAVKGSVSIMSAFRANPKWQVIATEWGGDIDSIDYYLEHLSELEREGLPNLVEQFRARLNKHATQSLARIEQRLLSEKEDIAERISTINDVLAKTEFRNNTHLKLGIKPEMFPHVLEFAKQMKTVISQVGSDDHELRFNSLKVVVDILDKASSSATANNKESLRLLDPRYQMSFYAEEIDNTTGDITDVLASSSGKSGGEKESFAGTIVAAALSYVLTPDGYDRPIYSTVFLDEAFSNTAEAVSRRVLKVFKELHIHVNLITPYKNLNLARESARSLLIAERDQVNHESRLCEVTWEEIDRRLQKKQIQQAQSVEIELV